MSETSEYAIHPIEALDQRAKRPAIGPQTGPLSNLNSLNLSCRRFSAFSTSRKLNTEIHPNLPNLPLRLIMSSGPRGTQRSASPV